MLRKKKGRESSEAKVPNSTESKQQKFDSASSSGEKVKIAIENLLKEIMNLNTPGEDLSRNKQINYFEKVENVTINYNPILPLTTTQ